MNLTTEEIAKITNSKIIGNKDFVIKNLSFAKDAKEGDLVLATNAKYFRHAIQSKASAILTNSLYEETDKIILIAENADFAFMDLLDRIYKQNIFHAESSPVSPEAKISPTAKIGFNSIIGKNTEIGENTVIHPNVYIGADCKIGSSCIIYANTSVYDRTVIGNNVIIHSNVTIGADGFGYEPCSTGLRKYSHIGNVELADCVEIGANTCIDRAKIGTTYIGYCTKIDNLCQIAHNVHIGKFNVICGQTGIAGSSVVCNQCIIGAQVGVADHVVIDDGCIVGAKTGVTKYVAPGSIIMGNPSHPVGLARRIEAYKKMLPETHKEFTDMKKRLKNLEKEVQSVKKKI